MTGGLDCLVKVWILNNNRLDLLYTLEGHSLAVVSVAVSPTAPSRFYATFIKCESYFHINNAVL